MEAGSEKAKYGTRTGTIQALKITNLVGQKSQFAVNPQVKIWRVCAVG